MKNNFKKISIALLISLPQISFAALSNLKSLIQDFGGVLKLTIPVLFGLALVFFFWGVAQFILNDAGNDKARAEGKNKIIWGIIALFVMVSIWGILGIFGSLFGIPTGAAPGGNLPSFPFNLNYQIPSGYTP